MTNPSGANGANEGGALDEQLERELAALADGSLAPERRAALELRVAGSPVLQALLAEQRRAVAVSQRTDRAPERLRHELERRAERSRPHHGRRAVIAVAAAAALALAFFIPRAGDNDPSVAEAAALSGRAVQTPAPAPYNHSPTLLDLEVEGVPYPNWERRFGWRAVGSRADRVGDRSTKTLFYAKAGRRIGYTIVSGPALPPARGALRLVRHGTELQRATLDDRVVVTWKRQGHTCVLAGADVDLSQLVELGAWKAGGAVPY
jgi:hypothetical protein